MSTYNNSTLTNITSGFVLHPYIACGSYCNLHFQNCAVNSKRTITVGTSSVTITIGSNGTADVSLMPFMRADMQSRAVQNSPFTTSWRGQLSVVISNADADTVAATLSIYYIYGFCHAAKAMDGDIWVTFNSADGDYNILAVDLESHYTSGTPNSLSSFKDISSDPAEWSNPPAENSVYPMAVQQVAASQIYTGTKNYHFTLDCRTEDIVQLRWIDGNGYPSTRKFAWGGENVGASLSDTYRILHNDHAFINNNTYDFGKDEWATITPQRTLTVGDDSIPMNQWEWVKSLISSQCVEMFEGGVWRRVNISSPAMERDPRKGVFSVNITLTLFADSAQQF